MQKRFLGNTFLETPPLILGTNVFGWTIDEQRSFEILDGFVNAGFNTLDTADVYSRWVPGNKGGESETIIGKWMKQKGNRDKVQVITKFGADKGNGPDMSAKNLVQSVEESLTRLQTDYIDLHLAHFDDGKTPVEETLEAYTKLVKEGKIKFIGASNFSPERLKASLQASLKNDLARYSVLEPHYNLYDHEKFEKEYLQICIDEKISVIPYYALASGFLTGKYRSENDLDKSQRGGGIKKYLTSKGFSILSALDQISKSLGATPAQVSIAWLISQQTITAAIASATSKEQLSDMDKAVNLSLSDSDRKLLTEASTE